MSKRLLISEVEARIDAWQRILENKRRESIPKTKALTITISREFGCEGFPLAERLKTLLEEKTGEEWVIFDRALIEQAAMELEISSTKIKMIEERFRFLDFFSSFFPKSYTKNQLMNQLSEYILNVAKLGNAIIVGRGGAYITRKLDNCFHFRLEAPLDFRITSISKRLEINEEAAEKFVMENSRKREEFLDDFFGSSINDPEYFHAIFNNQKMDLELITKCILKCIESKLKK
jgi:cytidylate kinase